MKAQEGTSKLICLHDPRSLVAESFRTLRTNIQFTSVNKELRSIMVTSAGAGAGKSTLISNLAVTMAQSGKRVILIDGDLRKPTLHHLFGLPNHKGLTSLLVKQVRWDEVICEVPDLWLDVIPAGPIAPNPAELLDSSNMQALIHSLLEQDDYDMVLIDAPPILSVTDPQLLASYVDGVLLVLESGKVVRDDARRAKALLDHVGANVIGAILNNKKMDVSKYLYYG